MAIIKDANRRIFYEQLSHALECFARKLGKSDIVLLRGLHRHGRLPFFAPGR
jgi:hypothetical protein